ncbi:LysR family transcriptional regulator [Duganella sp. BJB488]|uniref:LysR family transcriptional regulator n=2 Tax=Telluria group TaxID=2895353 RepID=A0A845G8V7_9BURK|nr:LysR family transcriptional regulator [Duganella vulcania]NVD74900.1 LysR family transcriptional regulator [Duganella sp. BJB1802]RFP26098.1 LysR family transcriptional regulator [Duganella sp. BJB489]RFP28163.1 LysR family transcriptional regulator [Duganella sp. BJB488]RFP37029.1 LysR family transcriptional regulator [Duganella sp. BJB480]
MEIFIEVARQRSFSEAGRRLGLTRAMVSKHILQLEDKLQARLLHRSTREVSLTDAGQAYLAPCIATVEQSQEAARALSQATQAGAELAGPLRIQAPSSFGSEWLADAVARFSVPHPQLAPMLYVDDALLDPIEHGFDLTVRVGGIPDVHALAMRQLAPCRGVLCASPAYLARHGVPQAPQDLHQHRCLHFSHLTDGTQWHFTRGAERQTVRVQAAFTANNGVVLQRAAQRGLGIVYNTTFLAWRALIEGTLVPVLADWELPLNHLSALYPASRQPSAKVRALIDFLVAEYQPVPPWDRELRSHGLLA